MTITCDTDLKDILSYDDVNNIVTEAGRNIRNYTRPRRANVVKEISTDGIKNALIADSNIMYTKGTEVKDAYGKFHTSLAELESEIRAKARNKEIEELNELITAINTKLSDLEAQKISLSKQIASKLYDEDDEEEAEYLQNRYNAVKQKITDYETKREAAELRLNERGTSYQSEEDELDDDTPAATADLSHTQRTEYNLKQGDLINIDGKQYEFLSAAKDEQGNTSMFCFGDNGQIYHITSDGQITDTEINRNDPYGVRIDEKYQLERFDSISTNNRTAADMGLPSQENITSGESENMDMHSYVQYGDLNPDEVTHVTNSNDLHQAASGKLPVITIDANRLEDNQNWFQNIIGPSNDITANNGTSQITLIYDSNTGKYYSMDQDGGYEKNYYNGITPEELQKFTIEI